MFISKKKFSEKLDEEYWKGYNDRWHKMDNCMTQQGADIARYKADIARYKAEIKLINARLNKLRIRGIII